MLVILGYAMVLTFMVLIMTKRMSPMLALIIVPGLPAVFEVLRHTVFKRRATRA